MKKIIAFLLAAVICVCFCSCKSEAVKTAEGLISAIGTVTASSGSAIEAAEAAYNALSEKDRQALEGADILQSAKETFNALVVQERIAGLIADATPDAEAIDAVEKAYEALTDGEKALVTNYDLISQARRSLMKQSLLGLWYAEPSCHKEDGQLIRMTIENSNHYYNAFERVSYIHPEYGEYEVSYLALYLTEDGFYGDQEEMVSKRLGSWDLSEDMTQLIIDPAVEGLSGDQLIFQIYEEDGFTKLHSNAYPYPGAFSFVREEDVDAAFEAKYVYVSDPEDAHQYFGDPISLGYLYDENGERITAYYEDGKKQFDIVEVLFFPSQIYDEGLTLLTSGRLDFTFSVGTTPGRGRTDNVVTVMGIETSNQKLTDCSSLCFVKSDHVAKNCVDESGCRTLELTDGTVIRYYNPEYIDIANCTWKYLQADYNDYVY